MANSEERARILKMIEEGKLTAEEGAQLIKSLGMESEATQTPKDPSIPDQPQDSSRRWFHIRVTDTTSGKPQVNIRIPTSLLRVGLKIGARFTPEIEKIDVEELNQFLNSNEPGPVIDVDTDEGQHVNITIE